MYFLRCTQVPFSTWGNKESHKKHTRVLPIKEHPWKTQRGVTQFPPDTRHTALHGSNPSGEACFLSGGRCQDPEKGARFEGRDEEDEWGWAWQMKEQQRWKNGMEAGFRAGVGEGWWLDCDGRRRTNEKNSCLFSIFCLKGRHSPPSWLIFNSRWLCWEFLGWSHMTRMRHKI